MTVKYEQTKKQRAKDIAAKKFYCEPCDKVFKDSYDLKNHMGIKLHNPHLYVRYECDKCNFKTKIKKSYQIHLESKKHKKKEE